jgi:hypothetical protein
MEIKKKNFTVMPNVVLDLLLSQNQPLTLVND